MASRDIGIGRKTEEPLGGNQDDGVGEKYHMGGMDTD